MVNEIDAQQISPEQVEIKPQLFATFSGFMGESIIPPSFDYSLRLNFEDFQENHPIRYDIFEEIKNLRTDFSQETQNRLKRLGKYLHILNSLDRYRTAHDIQSESGTETLWEEQISVFESIREGLEQGETEGYVKLPTGTGKTVLFTEFIEALGLTTANGEGIKSLIVVPTTIPIGQTEEALQEFAADIPYGKVYAEHKDLGEREQPVTIITDESLRVQLEKGTIDPNSYDLVVFDEAHNYLSAQKQKLVKDNFANAIKMGFTATPHYSKDKTVMDILPYEYASMSVKEGIHKGMLADTETVYVKCGIDISHVDLTKSDYDDADLEKKVDIKQINDTFSLFYKENFADESGIVPCVGVEHARHQAESFREHGIAAEAIHGYMSDDEKKDLMAKHESGEVQVLCFDKILAESYDQPRASVCLNLRPTMSVVMAEQRAGRVLRLDPNNPNKTAKVIDILYSNSNKLGQQVLFPEILGASRVYGPDHKSGGKSVRTLPPIQTKPISVEGIEVIIDPTEILKITQDILAFKYATPPEGWKLIGDIDAPNSLTNRYGISQGTIPKYIQQTLSIFKKSWENQGIAQDQWEALRTELIRTFYAHNGLLASYYSPEFIEVLDTVVPAKSPEGWMVIGEIGSNNTLAERYGASKDLLKRSIQKVMASFESQWEDAGITPNRWNELKNDLMGEFRGSREELMHYSPRFIEELDKVILPKPPNNWMAAGEVGAQNNLATKYQISYDGLLPYIQQLSAHFQKQWDEQEVPQDQRVTLNDRLMGNKYRGKVEGIMYYSPEFVEELDKIIPPKAPEGWMNMKKLSEKYSIAYSALSLYTQKVISMLQEQWDEQDIPQDQRKAFKDTYVGLYRGASGKANTHYSPDFIQELEKIVPLKAPNGWISMNKLARQMGIQTAVLQKRIDQVMERTRKQWAESGISDNQVQNEEKLLFGQYRSNSGISMYLSSQFVEELS